MEEVLDTIVKIAPSCAVRVMDMRACSRTLRYSSKLSSVAVRLRTNMESSSSRTSMAVLLFHYTPVSFDEQQMAAAARPVQHY